MLLIKQQIFVQQLVTRDKLCTAPAPRTLLATQCSSFANIVLHSASGVVSTFFWSGQQAYQGFVVKPLNPPWSAAHNIGEDQPWINGTHKKPVLSNQASSHFCSLSNLQTHMQG